MWGLFVLLMYAAVLTQKPSDLSLVQVFLHVISSVSRDIRCLSCHLTKDEMLVFELRFSFRNIKLVLGSTILPLIDLCLKSGHNKLHIGFFKKSLWQ